VATQTLGKAHNLAESGVETLPVPTGGPAAGSPVPAAGTHVPSSHEARSADTLVAACP